MNYKGKLYGKIAGKYFDTGVTSEDYDRLIEQNAEIVSVLKRIVDFKKYQRDEDFISIKELEELLTKYQKP